MIPHQGHNVKRVREILKIKQEVIAHDLGMTQSGFSQLESRDVIDEETLEQIAKSLKVSKDFIKNYSEQSAIFQIQNMHNSAANYHVEHFHNNPIDKMIELFDEKITTFKEKNELLEKLLESEKEKNQLLQQLLEERKNK